jgi:hypothetical protein
VKLMERITLSVLHGLRVSSHLSCVFPYAVIAVILPPFCARCLGTMIVIEEVTGATTEAEVEATEVVGAAVVAGEETEGLMLEPLGYTWAASPPGREAGIWKTSSPSMGGTKLFTRIT